MVNLIDLKEEIESLVASAQAFGATRAQADRGRLLGQIRNQVEKLRAADEKSRGELEEFYERSSEGDFGAAEPKRAALASQEDEGAAAKMLLPLVRSLQGYLTGTSLSEDPEAHQLLQNAVNIVAGYVAGYQSLRDQLIRFDIERRAKAGEVLQARPVEGDVDHEALTREITARFPKILATLAK